MRLIFSLFITMVKIGCVAFGGGYAIIALLENEFVSRRGWISHEEFLDVVVIAESTPGPIAINAATYVGYKRAGVWGSVAATVGICLPSFVLMYLVSLFYERFMAIELVRAAFRGIQICVVFLIARAGLKMLGKMKKTPLSVSIFALSLAVAVLLSVLEINVPSVWIILAAGVVGLVCHGIRLGRREEKKK